MNTSQKLTKARELLSEVFHEHFYKQENILWISNLKITMGGLDGVIQCHRDSPNKKKDDYVGERKTKV